ncbi:hypothetical protein BOX15_Mlig017382g1, partial [Macrostomum lignano]
KKTGVCRQIESMASISMWLLLPLMLLIPQGTTASNLGRPSIRKLLAIQIRSGYEPIRPGVVCSSCLISFFHTNFVRPNNEKVSLSELKVRTREYPASARDKIRMLQFGVRAKTSFENYTESIGSSYASRYTYIGTAIRINDRVHVGMLSADIGAYLVQKYRVFNKQECWRVLWILWKKCKNKQVRERRGFTANELNNIKMALQSEAMRALNSSLIQIHD